MHHQRLVLNGPPTAVARMAADLRAAGAVWLAPGAPGPARLVVASPQPPPVERLCTRHDAVIVGVERFEALGDELERLVLHGREATVLERRRVLPATDDGAALGGGVCLEDDGLPLDAAALRAAAARVAALPVRLGPGSAATALDDALLLGPSLGRLCVAAGDPLAAALPPAAALDAVAALAATALTIGAACAGSLLPAEQGFERAWRLTEAVAVAAREPLWSRPGDADWPEWLMDLLAGAAAVVECCAASLHQPPGPFVSLHAEHFATLDEQLDDVARSLVATALQALVLFDPSIGS